MPIDQRFGIPPWHQREVRRNNPSAGPPDRITDGSEQNRQCSDRLAGDAGPGISTVRMQKIVLQIDQKQGRVRQRFH